ncbi:type I-D CRISPR-associated helicase Cas3' [Bacillus aquiflavi]|uniref:Type I-D CRISPR-associated helicase Cas3 n=1 Tax=Bacillus aquiflavi TaxID=2672567 RepID=A0A6B3VUY3_9BACI|nr:type I-D CRISPR-associated helicase Cas3' [Bacillus aquiflavi]MBA4537824.1 type I-D CRISPR-associated helicase Cas3' [Bacillus aquiflavi]NEY82080.1 type I-D CRISPR-associated helicase Cas3' [Bacillus aquiflavi]
MYHLRAERAFTYDKPFMNEINPYAHQYVQLELIRKAFAEKKNVVIWNEAMTGAGKTLANYSYLAEQKDVKAIGVYPVNELVKDQFLSLEENLPKDSFEEFVVWTSEELNLIKEQCETRLQQLKRLSGRFSKAILTNPDYLTLIAQERLFAPKLLRGDKHELFHQLAVNYRLQIFDEFHLYSITEMNLIAQWIALLTSFYKEMSYVFVFSSATPNEYFEQLISNAGLEIWKVKDEIDKWESEQKDTKIAERIFLEPLRLQLIGTSLAQWNTSEKLKDYWETFEHNYLVHFPDAKGLIVFDSIYEAEEVARFLKSKGYDVGEVHGLSEREQGKSRAALGKQITVATATIEVGVDFKDDIHKDYIIFEARNPGSFMQRLGRIGRGKRKKPNPLLYAIAFVPEYVEEFINNRADQDLDRSTLKSLVISGYDKTENFSNFIEKTGGMMLLHSEYFYASQFLDESEKLDYQTKMKKLIENMYHIAYEEQRQRYRTWRNDKLIEPLLSFRGQNMLESLEFKELDREETFYPDLWFWEENTDHFPLKKYDYSYIFRNYHFYFVTKEELLERLKKYDQSKLMQYENQMKRYPALGYAVLTKRRDRADRVSFYWDLSFRIRSHIDGEVTRTANMQLASEDPSLNLQLQRLNRQWKAEKKSWIIYVSSEEPYQLQRRYKLPPMFRIYQARYRNRKMSVSFNIDAFKLWSVCERIRSDVI